MALEIERKFLVSGDFPMDECVEMVQGYLCRDIGRTVRVRVQGDEAVLTVKGMAVGITRNEFEYAIPVSDAREMLKLADGAVIEKTRYYHRTADHTWEIDVFTGDNEGLVVAEIELQSEDEPFETPVWIGEEVTADMRYANSSLSKYPYCRW